MASLPDTSAPSQDVLLYGRNSTDDQAEAGTIRNQQDFLRSFTGLYRLTVVGEFWDEGISGTIPLEQRPDGRRLIGAARAHPGAAVLCYRLDRLGRSLRALLDAHDQLAAADVTIRSASEPFDTSTPIGKFLFQLLASLAELDRASLLDRMVLGRDRVARDGKWNGGGVPFGIDLDAERRPVKSVRLVPGVEMTESEMVADLVRRIAEGSSAKAEARRLQALSVPSVRRYSSGKEWAGSAGWTPNRVARLVGTEAYSTGVHVLKSKKGAVERAIPRLVPADLQARAITQLSRNRKTAKAATARAYLLRGLVRCADPCGLTYTGIARPTRAGERRYYRCTAAHAPANHPGRRCCAQAVPADELEAEVWADCAAVLRNPEPYLAEAQRQLRARLGQVTRADEQRKRLLRQVAGAEAERDAIMTLYRRKKITLADAERQLDDIAAQTAEARRQLDAMRAQEDLAEAMEAHVMATGAMLREMGAQVDEIERTDDWGRKRYVVERLVAYLEVDAEGSGLDDRVTVHYQFADPSVNRDANSLQSASLLTPLTLTAPLAARVPIGV